MLMSSLQSFLSSVRKLKSSRHILFNHRKSYIPREITTVYPGPHHYRIFHRFPSHLLIGPPRWLAFTLRWFRSLCYENQAIHVGRSILLQFCHPVSVPQCDMTISLRARFDTNRLLPLMTVNCTLSITVCHRKNTGNQSYSLIWLRPMRE